MTSQKITRTRWRCDHCKRGSWTRRQMERHESGCALNPNRKCAMHAFGAKREPQRSTAELVAAARLGLDALRDTAANCPACILAGIRNLSRRSDGVGIFDPLWEDLARFNFRKEREQLWIAEARRRPE